MSPVASGAETTLNGFLSQALLLAVAVTRTAAAFSLMPILTPEIVPALVRNSLFVGFSLIVLATQPQVLRLQLSSPEWVALFAREGSIGLAIGFLFGVMLWAFEAAGRIIDAKAGAATAEIVDPLSGETTSLNGAFLSRLAAFVFMFSGGLLMFVTVLLRSYAIWPLAAAAPHFALAGAGVFESAFARLMGLALVFAAPALVLLTLAEGAMGLMNRFAPQLNVFSMSLSLKAWLATLIILATCGLFIESLENEIASRPAAIEAVLKSMARR